MNRLLVTACIVLGFASVALAQSTTDTTSTDATVLAGKSALENSGTYSARSPGSWVRSAIARHKSFIESRVTGPLAGEIPELPTETTSTSSTSSTGTVTNTIANLLTGGSSGVTDLLGSLGGTGDGNDALVQYIMSLANANGSTNKSSNQKASQNTSTKVQQRLADDTTTTTTTTERPFKARLLESWASTFFSAITVGFQSTDFIEVLKDALRPLVLPDSSDGNGDGIEDVDNNDGETSTI
jgi:hypothetical protein